MKALGSDRATFKTNMPELWSNPLPCKGWGKSLPLTQHISPHQSQHKIQLGNLIWQSMYNKTFVVFSPVQGKSENPWRQKQGMQTRLQLPLIAHLHRLLNLLQTLRQFLLIPSTVQTQGLHDPVRLFWNMLCTLCYFSFSKLCSYILSSVEFSFIDSMSCPEYSRGNSALCITDESSRLHCF